ncbi:hypothetical protein [Streptomyces lasiicapitis]|uniref:hypothetical protein n=1 Tax=Streptomyces lasiicapitis TaxID=1923961 RepID=UPI00166343A0|nr:hypothetical protein [Streptomyces lasiicapitis]
MGIGTAVLLTTGGMATAVAQDGLGGQDARGVKATSKANASWGYAKATWKWKGAGSTGKVKVYVDDQDCNGYSVYAKMQFKRATGQIVDGDNYYWNSDSRCRGKGQTRNGPKFSDNFNITHGRVVVCQSDWGWDTCKNGKWHKNPKA